MGMGILPSGPIACNRGDRTDGTDGSPTSHEETLAYYRELRHLPALRGSSFEGATVRHLLDMTAGTRFSEDYGSLQIWQLIGNLPQTTRGSARRLAPRSANRQIPVPPSALFPPRCVASTCSWRRRPGRRHSLSSTPRPAVSTAGSQTRAPDAAAVRLEELRAACQPTGRRRWSCPRMTGLRCRSRRILTPGSAGHPAWPVGPSGHQVARE